MNIKVNGSRIQPKFSQRKIATKLGEKKINLFNNRKYKKKAQVERFQRNEIIALG